MEIIQTYSDNHQQNQQQDVKPLIKKGWLYKKGLISYKIKYAVFSTSPNNKPNLQIFESRDAHRPKYQIYCDSIIVSVPTLAQQTGGLQGWLVSALTGGGGQAAFDFVVETRSRRFFFRAQTAKERDEWVDILKQFSRNLPSQNPHMNSNDYDMRRIDNQDPYGHNSDDHQQSHYDNGNNDGDERYDARSVVSFKSYRSDRASVYNVYGNLASGRSSRASLAASRASSHGLVWRDEDYGLENGMLYDVDLSSKNFKYPALPYLSQTLNKSEVESVLKNIYTTPKLPLKSKDLDWNSLYQNADDNEKIAVIGDFKSLAQDILINIVHSSLSIPQVFQHSSILFHVGGKRANLELQAINAVLGMPLEDQQLKRKIATSLVCCVEYRGVSFIACPLLPLDEQTRRYDDDDVNGLRNAINRYSKTDGIEFHKVDGLIYCVNLQNVLVVDDQWKDQFARFRPELIFGAEGDATRANLKQRLDNVISQFCRKCDALELTPVDSRGLTAQLHKHGINVRYLGRVCNETKVPYLKDLAKIDMVSRALKSIMRDKICRTVERYRSIEATNVDHDLKHVVLKMVNHVLCEPVKIFHQLSELVKVKFNYDLVLGDLKTLHKPALLHAIKYQCGLKLHLAKQSLNLPLEKHQIDRFECKTTVPQPPASDDHTLMKMKKDDTLEKLGYSMARHFNYLGADKLARNEVTAMKLANLAKSLNEIDPESMIDNSKFYCNLACRFAPIFHPVAGLVHGYWMEVCDVKTQGEIFDIFDKAYRELEFHLGPDHPIIMTLYDKTVLKLSSIGMEAEAMEILSKSMLMASKILGPSHPTTSGYKTKCGYMLMTLHKYKEALSLFKEALGLFRSQPIQSNETKEAIAENLYCIAECLFESGGHDDAIAASQEGKVIREQIYGSMHAKTIDSYQQYGKLLSIPFADYSGVLTDKIRKQLTTAINCYEKVFRYMKQMKSDTNILLDTTRTLVTLKMRAFAQDKREIVRILKTQNVVYEEHTVKEAILKLVHLTPTVFLEEIFQRISDGDEDALVELGAAMQVIESSKISTKHH